MIYLYRILIMLILLAPAGVRAEVISKDVEEMFAKFFPTEEQRKAAISQYAWKMGKNSVEASKPEFIRQAVPEILKSRTAELIEMNDACNAYGELDAMFKRDRAKFEPWYNKNILHIKTELPAGPDREESAFEQIEKDSALKKALAEAGREVKKDAPVIPPLVLVRAKIGEQYALNYLMRSEIREITYDYVEGLVDTILKGMDIHDLKPGVDKFYQDVLKSELTLNPSDLAQKFLKAESLEGMAYDLKMELIAKAYGKLSPAEMTKLQEGLSHFPEALTKDFKFTGGGIPSKARGDMIWEMGKAVKEAYAELPPNIKSQQLEKAGKETLEIFRKKLAEKISLRIAPMFQKALYKNLPNLNTTLTPIATEMGSRRVAEVTVRPILTKLIRGGSFGLRVLGHVSTGATIAEMTYYTALMANEFIGGTELSRENVSPIPGSASYDDIQHDPMKVFQSPWTERDFCRKGGLSQTVRKFVIQKLKDIKNDSTAKSAAGGR